MPQRSHTIPLNKQTAQAIGGLEMSHMSYKESLEYAGVLDSHRDDYYMMVILIKGKGSIRCDMETLSGESKSILIIKPYQVHAVKEVSEDTEGYFLTIAPFLVPEHCINILQELPVSRQHLKIPNAEKNALFDTALLLYRAFTEKNAHQTFIIHSLFNALINRITAMFAEAEKTAATPQNQSQLIAQKFRQLVEEHSFLHPPSFFSEKLNITTSHLNDCVKSVTGLSVTHYLQEAMLLEAKRNLYYTNNDVKTIAFRLGFEDHTYFSRLFKKLTKETPLSFRNKFRE